MNKHPQKLTISLGFFTALTLLASPSIAKQPKITDNLIAQFEATVSTAMATYGVPGAAIVIVEGDEVVYQSGFGLRDIENNLPITPETVFPLASVTKPLTTTMIATLVDDGFLTWKQKVKEIWPDFTLPTKKLTRKVQVRHLMQMNTGLGEPSIVETFYAMRIRSVSAEDVLNSLDSLPIVADLGKIYYGNSHTFAASGFIAALASGAEYGNLYNGYKQLMQERVFDPIGMDSAFLPPDLPMNDDYATGYSFNLVTGTLEPLVNPNVPNLEGYVPSGFVVANALDLANFLITQLNKGIAPNGTRVVSVKNLKKTQQPKKEANNIAFSIGYPLAQSTHYGMGWAIAEQINGVKVIGHAGAGEGFVTDMAFIPDADIGIVTLTNLNFYDGYFSGAHFIGVVRDSLFELIYDLEPTVAEEWAQEYQYQMEQMAIPPELIQVTFTPDMVGPYLGNYEKGWRVELRENGTLWVVLQDIYEYQLVSLPGDIFIISNNGLVGTQIMFSTNTMSIIIPPIIAPGDTETLVKLD
jgi:CubicO group peptidase (beta-lactamase class C family)